MINFPNNPNINDTTTINGRDFKFNGVGWVPTASGTINVVQTTGASTTDVMSQDAVTSLVSSHVDATSNAHNASAISLTSGKSLQQAIDDGDIGGGGGHVIEDASNPFTQRPNLQFTGGVTITDDSVNDRTIVKIDKSS